MPKNPHGVNASPDQKYFICAGKLSPTGTVIETVQRCSTGLKASWKSSTPPSWPRVELGLGPLHTAFDGRGNAYTTLFLDSQVVKWNVETAIKFHAGDKTAKYVVDRLDVQYQPGHVNASHLKPSPPTAGFLAVGCRFSRTASCPWARCTLRTNSSSTSRARRWCCWPTTPCVASPMTSSSSSASGASKAGLQRSTSSRWP